MSCMIQKVENTAKLAEFIAMCGNSRRESYSYIVPESLLIALKSAEACDQYGYCDPAKVYYALRDLNLEAYAGRYGGEYDADCLSEYMPNGGEKLRPEWDCGEPDERGNYRRGHWAIKPEHFQMYKTAQFFCYQCDEDATYTSDLFKAMSEFEKNFAAFIVHNLPEYVGAGWQ